MIKVDRGGKAELSVGGKGGDEQRLGRGGGGVKKKKEEKKNVSSDRGRKQYRMIKKYGIAGKHAPSPGGKKKKDKNRMGGRAKGWSCEQDQRRVVGEPESDRGMGRWERLIIRKVEGSGGNLMYESGEQGGEVKGRKGGKKKGRKPQKRKKEKRGKI